MRTTTTTEDLLTNQSPDTPEKYVGIEVECYSGAGESVVMGKLLNSSIKDYVTIGEDSSVEYPYSGNNRDYEFRILVPVSQLRTVLTGVCAFLKDIKAKVNASCGLHVHLDMRSHDVSKAFYNLAVSEKLLMSCVKEARRKSTYCHPVNSTSYKKAIEEHTKYRTINASAYNEHKTLEVRVHHGSVKFEEIYPWTKVLVALAYGPKLAEGQALSTLPLALRKWVRERRALYPMKLAA